MRISNLQIRKTLKLAPIVLIILVGIDILFLFIPGFFGGLKLNGYVAVAIPLLAIGFYSYVGYPLFTFDAKSDVIKIKTHMALSQFFGKKLAVPRMNITGLAIDESTLRDKLVVTYINRHGKEVSDEFSITILSERKKEMLKQAIESLNQEHSPKNLHLFI
jgi:hypothetical protein